MPVVRELIKENKKNVEMFAGMRVDGLKIADACGRHGSRIQDGNSFGTVDNGCEI
jgi:hypothetical protein